MMQGYTANYVNLIADNLRDRYGNGFPILKELIQNADDAKARTLIFGSHPGFPDASNPLLKGSGFWCFNDGEFKKKDVEDLRSFGFNSKAGDSNTIGKFGLGMKSVFHLCEALFYVAWDGTELHREGLTPWKQGDRMPHPEWDETTDADWEHLAEFGRGSSPGGDSSWFLLWIPLRSRSHLETPSGEESGSIIRHFPGDDPSGGLAFLNDTKLAHDVAEMLPLLRHLDRVEHRGEANPFVLQLADGPRLMGITPREQVHGATVHGQVLKGNGQPLLCFSGRRHVSPDADGCFAKMKALGEWPRTRSRDELGRETLAEDKTSAEGAVLLCSGRDDASRSRLQWAVFLPVEDDSEDIRVDRVTSGFSLILHGQFFLDSGRKRLHGLSLMGDEPLDLGNMRGEESNLRTNWNQRLGQDVVLPLVLPVLDDHVRQHALSEGECIALTKALSNSGWFKKFRKHICRDAVWLRILEHGSKPRWRLVEESFRTRLRPVPSSPGSDPERPWKIFVELTACNVIPYDREAPHLGDVPCKWEDPELARILSHVEGLFVHAPSMDYLIEFLDSCARSNLSAESIQQRLLALMRRGLHAAGTEARRRLAAKARKFVAFLDSERRLDLSADLSEPILNEMWEIDAPVLLVPKDMDPEPHGNARPAEQALADWMRVLDRALDSAASGSDEADRILRAAQGLLKTLATEARGRFLRINKELRIIEVQDARSGLKKPVSFEFLEHVRGAGALFHFAAGLREARMGITPLLARTVPDAEICLVQADTYRQLFPDDGAQGRDRHIPAASDGPACLAAVGRLNTGQLGEIADRRNLLEKANDPGADPNALRGLRFLLHGSLGHRMDDQAALWIGRHNQHPAWSRLWDAMHGGERWSRIPEELADAVPRSRWRQANIAEIDARTLLDLLDNTVRGIEAPEEFSEEEREEILSQVDREELWLRLPLHTTVSREPDSAAGELVYLAPAAACHEEPLTHEIILIVPSQNPAVAARQKQWLSPWDDRARIEIALDTGEPSRYWCSVMDALHALGDPPASISGDVRDLLRSRKWLPITCSEPVKPEDVIDLQGSLEDEAHRLVAKHRSGHGPCFAVPAEIAPEVHDHPAWERLRKEGFSSDSEGLEHLGLLLEDLRYFNIGAWQKQPDNQEIELLSHCEELPGWRLLKTATAEPFDLETAWRHLGPPLSKEIEPEQLLAVLN